MNPDPTDVDGGARLVTELGKRDVETRFREREIAVKEQEQRTREAELDLKKLEQGASRWRSPLVIAILAATVAALGNAAVSVVNGSYQRRLEAEKSEQARILEMIKTGDVEKAAQNLKFLLSAGLITEPVLQNRLERFLAERKTGSGPVLPPAAVQKLDAPIIENARVYLLAGKMDKTSTFRSLRDEMGTAGFAVIGAKYLVDKERQDEPEIRYFNPGDKDQAERIAEFMRFKLESKTLQARAYQDARAKPGYIEIWLGR